MKQVFQTIKVWTVIGVTVFLVGLLAAILSPMLLYTSYAILKSTRAKKGGKR